MGKGSVVWLLIAAIIIGVAATVFRALVPSRKPPPRRRSPTASLPTTFHAPELTDDERTALTLICRHKDVSTSFQDLHNHLETSLAETAQVIDALRRHGLVDWFGASHEYGGHGYPTFRGRKACKRFGQL